MMAHLALIIDMIILALAALLAFISWRAYRRSNLKSLLLLMFAFVLVGLKKIVENLPAVGTHEYSELVIGLIELSFVVLVFVAIAKER
ncbi:DUF7521 family protein [Palaeococcus ferrophilus]|uniref:DUF7521 family protein n=1 Tax=Palaeococcus ferrophilus TaxID=83868 RepID=UPI00064F6764|nr:hypothetical protein [Palaeococcus ferrophilus]